MSVHLEERKATVGLETRLDHVPKVLEKRDEVVLRSVGGKVPHVTGRLPLRSLCDDHFIALDTLSWEVMVAIVGSRRSHSHGGHSLLLGDGGLTLLVGPVATNGTRTKPLAVHGAEGLLGISTFAEGDKAVATRAASLHVPHDTGLGNRSKGRERLEEDLVIHFVTEIADKNVEVVGGIFLVIIVRLVGPVNSYLLLEQRDISHDLPRYG